MIVNLGPGLEGDDCTVIHYDARGVSLVGLNIFISNLFSRWLTNEKQRKTDIRLTDQ